MTRFAAFLPAAALLLTAGVASATDTGGVKVNGVLLNGTYAEENDNVAIGNYATAVQSIGSVHGGTEVNGVVANFTYSYDNDNLSVGNYSTACQSVGSIGDAKGCEK